MPTSGYIDRGLSALIRSLASPPHARVGILAGQSRKPGPQPARKVPTNAEVGAAHEYGAPNRGLPQRSWLRAPLIAYMATEIEAEKAKIALRRGFAQGARTGKIHLVIRQIATIGERVVRIGFTNNGYGKWAGLKPDYAAQKTVKNILVETTQLRESVTSDVVGGK